jgi:phosphoenolpyruvate carboxykinase (GTP)
MADYFAHWLSMEQRVDEAKLPKIFYVNWFRKDTDGRWLWPGFGENSRVLEWVFERCAGTGEAVETPIGLLPAAGAIPIEGADVSAEDMAELLRVDSAEWRNELPSIEAHYAIFGDRLPAVLRDELEALRKRLGD